MKNINFWQNKRILITGGCGFLGRHLISNIKGKTRTSDLIIIQRKDFDLRKEKNIERLFKQHKNIDIIIHLAADVGGIAYNRKFQGEVFYNNLIMNTLLMEYSRLNKIGKFVGTGTVCSYPKFTPVPFVEKNLWLGYPEETNA